jgi:hypothetical protein
LRKAFQARGGGLLLYVIVAERPSEIATVEPIGEDFLLGYIERLRWSGDTWNIDFDSWSTICEAAFLGKNFARVGKVIPS